MSAHSSFVATYSDHQLAKADIAHLLDAGFDMSKLRLVAHGYPITAQVPVLASLGDLDVPMFDCIPEADLVDYESELNAGRWILVAHGSRDEIEHAWQVTEATHPTNWEGVADANVYYGCAD